VFLTKGNVQVISSSAEAKEPAQELAGYLSKILSCKVIAKKGAAKKGSIPIFLKIVPFPEELASEEFLRNFFSIQTGDSSITMSGVNEESLFCAVYHFLERFCGVRFFFPAGYGKEVPALKRIFIPEGEKMQEVPSFYARNLLAGNKEWGLRHSLGGFDLLKGGGHAFNKIVPPELLKTKPEYFALFEGKRQVHQLCTTHPEVIERTVSYVDDFFRKNRNAEVCSISPNDYWGFCECPRCRRLDSKNFIPKKQPPLAAGGPAFNRENVSRRIFTFVNEVARRIEKRHPGRYILTFAYGSYVEPPPGMKIRDNVIVWFCVSCVGHWHKPRAEKDAEILKKWRKAAKNVAVYEYYLNQSWPGLPRLVPSLIANFLKVLHREGVRLFYSQSAEDYGISFLNYYVAGRLLWNVHETLEDIYDDLFPKMFGKAGGDMRKYFSTLEDAYKKATENGDLPGSETVIHSYRAYDQILRIYTKDTLNRCKRYLAKSLKKAENRKYRKRIKFFRYGFDYTVLTVKAVESTKRIEEEGFLPFNPRPFISPSEYDYGQAVRLLRDMPAGERRKLKKKINGVLALWKKRKEMIVNLEKKKVLDSFWTKGGGRFDPSVILQEIVKEAGI
jgi:hypothetical protein